MFEVLPYELIVKIISYLDFKELLLTYKVSKQFKNVHDIYLIPILKEILTNKGVYVENISSEKRLKDIYKYVDLNKRICGECLKCTLKSHDYIVGNNGKVYITSYIFDNNNRSVEINMLQNIDNIISVAGNDYGEYLFLCNDGYVYSYDVNSELNKIPSLVLKSENEYLDDIVQVVMNEAYSFFLTSEGKVYVINEYIYPEIIYGLDDIIQINTNNENTLFLQKNGNVYKFKDDNTVTLIFQNVKKILISNYSIATIDTNNNLRKYNNKLSSSNVNYPKIINDIKPYGHHLLILTSNFELDLYTDTTIYTIIAGNNIVDFYFKFNNFYVLDSENKLTLYRDHQRNNKDFNINGKISIVDNSLIMIDNILYYVDDNSLDEFKDYKYNLIKI